MSTLRFYDSPKKPHGPFFYPNISVRQGAFLNLSLSLVKVFIYAKDSKKSIELTSSAPVDVMDSMINTDVLHGEMETLGKRPIKVSELVAKLKFEVEENHRHVCVVGEVSSFKQWRSGHCYFDIKDEHALMPAVMFRPHFAKVPFKISDGLEVLFSGRVSIYPANSRLQMIVESMEPLGQGALALAFEQLKARLSAEGLFEAKYKKPIKAFSQCVGLVTSSHGAVLRDMVRILKSRMPQVDILFTPVRVQGVGAAEEIARGIALLDSLGACDVIIVGRGGGSLEDLWAFNEEITARAIFRAKTPIISAVGHETDTTISDFVADVRAATPTHAASMVVPELVEIMAQLRGMFQGLTAKKQAIVKHARLELAQERQRLKDPRVLLYRHWQKLDEHSNRLNDAVACLLRAKKNRLLDDKNQLQQFAPFRQLRLKKEALFAQMAALIRLCPKIAIDQAKGDLKFAQNMLQETVRTRLVKLRHNFSHLVIELEALSPLKVLGRGYSLVQNADGHILSKMDHFHIEQLIRIRIEDGVVSALVNGKEA
ncbi:MAG TPA: exodeoxyribonuclease VII large subunit [Myxococcota bacterium]|nr:exodeoxyribonuclease VII large subunit [Myxococcota bacterium]